MKILFIGEIEKNVFTEKSFGDYCRLKNSFEVNLLLGVDYENMVHQGYKIIDGLVQKIEKIILEESIDFIVLSFLNHSDIIGPKLAHRLGRKVYLDCENLKQEDDFIYVKRKVYGGNVDGLYKVGKEGILAFAQTGIEVQKDKRDEAIDIKMLSLDNGMDQNKNEKNAQFLSRILEIRETEELSKAKKVIVCGYGVGSKKEVDQIVKYGKSVGATIGGTKKVVDFGWLPAYTLVGQTGKVIGAEVCLCIGVSGARPFINGILNAKKVIAINKDKDARIFNYADIGVVGDYHDYLELE
jgi:electron transfer flavoprotein alpha subunit